MDLENQIDAFGLFDLFAIAARLIWQSPILALPALLAVYAIYVGGQQLSGEVKPSEREEFGRGGEGIKSSRDKSDEPKDAKFERSRTNAAGSQKRKEGNDA